MKLNKQAKENITFLNFPATFEVPRAGTSATVEKVFPPVPEPLDLTSILTDGVELRALYSLHFVLCPERQCELWQVDELEKDNEVIKLF